MAKTPATKLYTRRVWGGFVSGKLATEIIDDGWGGWGRRVTRLAIFTNRKSAREQYRDVRPIDITEAKP